MPAVKVGRGKYPTKDRTVAEQTPQSHFHFCLYKSTLDSDKLGEIGKRKTMLYKEVMLTPSTAY